MGTHDDVIRIFFFGLFQDQRRWRSRELYSLNRQVGRFDFLSEAFELAGDRFFARGDDFPDVFEHRAIVAGDDGWLRYAHDYDTAAAGSSKDAGRVDDSVAHARKINWGKDGFHVSTISQFCAVGCA